MITEAKIWEHTPRTRTPARQYYVMLIIITRVFRKPFTSSRETRNNDIISKKKKINKLHGLSR